LKTNRIENVDGGGGNDGAAGQRLITKQQTITKSPGMILGLQIKSNRDGFKLVKERGWRAPSSHLILPHFE
jgi:hypothetical protein